jgi:hypothetical protein
MAHGYTVLTHEAIIDSVWDTAFKKALLKRFPGATAQELAQAHAYAYGGCIIQDMGYYPFSSRFFSDLTHYVRSGDFIQALIRESHDLNEFAFALGALEHFAADTEGHRLGTNKAVPLLYPELRRKYGKEVTYWDNPVAHIRTEFGFDVLQVALGRYAPEGYRKFIGFKVSKELLERAFVDTYGLEMKEVFGSLSLALGSYRHTVGSIIPVMTRVAWNLKKEQLQREIPGITRKVFLYHLSRASYEKEWGKEYYRPGFVTQVMTLLFRILPESGPFRALKFRTPTAEVEKMFMASFNATITRYTALLGNVSGAAPALPNENFDVGVATVEGKYKGSDEAYAMLLGKLAERRFERLAPGLRQNILAYYKDLKPASSLKSGQKERDEAVKLRLQIEELKAVAEPVAAK